MKFKNYLRLFYLIVILIGIFIFPILKQYRRKTTDVVFDYIRREGISPLQPKFTQIKRITLRQGKSGNIRLNIQMAAPLQLKSSDRLLIRISLMRTQENEELSLKKSEQIEIVIPIGYSYASYPSLPSGYTGVVSYGKIGQKLLSITPSYFDKKEISVNLKRGLMDDPVLPWNKRFLDADVLYIPGALGGKKAYQKGVTMGSSDSYVDTLQLEEGPLRSRVVPHHPGSSWKEEKPTTLPAQVKEIG